MSYKSIAAFTFALFLSACSENGHQKNFIESLTFYASYDGELQADFAKGDPNFYMSPTWAGRNEPVLMQGGNEHVAIHKNEGKYGDALWIDNSWTPVYFYKGKENIKHRDSDWSGTVSFWMRLDPDEDLPAGFSDPLLLTDSGWNDGALFVDFTDDAERIFRFAFFADRDIWDPDLRDWDDVPFEERPMIEFTEPVFSRDEWTHVAFTFRNFNSGGSDGEAYGYINGKHIGVLSGRDQTISWNPDLLAIWLGYNFRGYLDELAIFNRELSQTEIEYIFSLEQTLGNLLN